MREHVEGRATKSLPNFGSYRIGSLLTHVQRIKISESRVELPGNQLLQCKDCKKKEEKKKTPVDFSL